MSFAISIDLNIKYDKIENKFRFKLIFWNKFVFAWNLSYLKWEYNRKSVFCKLITESIKCISETVI